MQVEYEADMLRMYSPFLHKQAGKYYNRHRECHDRTQYDYEEFYQEAAIGFVEALRSNSTREYPLSPTIIGYARHAIHRRIVRDLLLHYDGIHRTEHKEMVQQQSLSTVHMIDSPYISEELSYTDEALSAVECRATIETLPPLHIKVARALSQGITKNQLVSGKVVSRWKLDRIIRDLQAVLVPEG